MKKERKQHQPNKILTYIGVGGLFLIIIAVILAVDVRNNYNEVTGSPVFVNYQGVLTSGKMQTNIILKQPTSKTMGKIQGGSEMRDSVANDIIQVADFTTGIVELYQNGPPTVISVNSLEKISTGASLEANYFISDTTCLKKTGENLGHWGVLEINLFSELKFQRCNKDPDQLFAYMKHSFFNKEGNRFICSQGSIRNKLFLINEAFGTINTNTTIC